MRFRWWLLIAFAVFVGAFFTAILVGSVPISLRDSFHMLLSKIPGLGSLADTEGIPDVFQTILFQLRLPRTLMALFAGVGLSAAGCIYQGVFSNPMADPYLLGVSSGAAFGATLSVLLPFSGFVFWGIGTRNIFSFVGSLAVLAFVFLLAQRKNAAHSLSLILSGIAMNYFLSSMISLLMFFDRDKLEDIYFWTMGSFKNSSWTEVGVTAVATSALFFVLFCHVRELNLIMMGEEQAKTMGVAVAKIKRRVLILSSLMVAVIVSSCGIVGFVGLIIPHAGRLLVGPDHKKLLPFSALSGAAFLILCDTLARSLFTNVELSVGILTSLFGVPFFLLLLRKGKRSALEGG